ncbi:MAG: hypothetical protein PQ612_05220 [Rickettsiales bacterium]|nr:hypothetical protein [Pseudomonadota bacterium]MDA0966419.1 hypothetical protein [Pseudomonadota bacterium]MDG4543281.1 hypothetical protein [Rickettsiales bacterium]MDG4545547.1 hypothetical protein [Rickettsiales bacterium]MDG4547996.1 hypothetical protein [Rickettsiales bacterium]
MEEEKKEERKELPLTEPKRFPRKLEEALEPQERWLEPRASVNKFTENLKQAKKNCPESYLKSTKQESSRTVIANNSWRQNYSSEGSEKGIDATSKISFHEEAEVIEAKYEENTRIDKSEHYKKIQCRVPYSCDVDYYQRELEKIGVRYSDTSHGIAKKIALEKYDSTARFILELEDMGIKRETVESNIRNFFYKGYDEVKQFLPNIIENGVEPDKASDINDKLFNFKYETPDKFLYDLVSSGLDKEKAKEHADFFRGFLNNKKSGRSFVETIKRNDCRQCIIL